MQTFEISKDNHGQIARAYQRGRRAERDYRQSIAACVLNPYAGRHGMLPEPIASVRCSKWHAFEAGRSHELGEYHDAYHLLRSARFCMLRATVLGRA